MKALYTWGVSPYNEARREQRFNRERKAKRVTLVKDVASMTVVMLAFACAGVLIGWVM